MINLFFKNKNLYVFSLPKTVDNSAALALLTPLSSIANEAKHNIGR